MALQNVPIVHTIVAIDQEGTQFRLSYPSNSTNITLAQALGASFAARFALVSDLKIVKSYWTFGLEEDDYTPPAAAEGEKKAVVTAQLNREALPLPGQSKTANINIPAPKNSIFLTASGDGNKIVDVTNADLLSYLALFEKQVATSSLLVSDYQTIKDPSIAGNIKGKKQHRGSKSG